MSRVDKVENYPTDDKLSVAVFTNRINRTTFQRFHAFIDIFLSGRLFKNIGVTTVVLTHKKIRRGFATKIAINALRIDVEFTSNAFGVFIVFVCHN